MKKAISLLSSLLLVALMLVPAVTPVLADGFTVTVTQSVDTLAVGEEVTYTVSLSGTCEAKSGKVQLLFNKECFELVAGTGRFIKNGGKFPVTPGVATEYVFGAIMPGAVTDFSGEYFTVTLKAIAETTVPQEMEVTVELKNGTTSIGKDTATIKTTVTPAPCEHDWGEGQVTTDATCTAPGVRTYTCSKCQNTKTEPIPALGHEMTHHPANAATCGASGNSEYYSCSRCEKFFKDEAGNVPIDKDSWVIGPTGEHDWSNWTPEDGVNHKRICSVCSKSETEAHEWDNGRETTPATCTAPGVKTYTCAKCGKTRTETLVAPGHDLKGTPANAATCGAPGNHAYYTCSVCHKVFKDAGANEEYTKENEWVIPATGNHDYDEVETKKATCTEKGEKKLTCKVCNHTKTVETPALGHETTLTPAKAATCGAAGNSAYYTCSRCNKYFSDANGANEIAKDSWVIPASGNHDYDEEVTKQPSCTEKGEKKLTCKVCSHTKTVEIPAQGHDMTKTPAKAATCVAAGNTEYYSCSRCQKHFSDVNGANEIAENSWIIPATGVHTYTETVTKKATCTEKGEKKLVCSVCDDTKTVEIDALGHNEETVEVTKPATCIVDGEKVYKCSRCGEVQKTEVIKAEGHKFSTEWTVDVEATVGKAGSKSHHCLNCDERADVTEIPALTDNTPTPKPDTPKTGENNVWYLCVIVLVVVSGAAVTLTVLRKKAR